jgi:hypothetical protein
MIFINGNIPINAVSHITISNSRFQSNEIFLNDGSKRSCSDVPTATRTMPASPGLELHTASRVRLLLMWEIAQGILDGGDTVILPMGLNGSEPYFIHDSNTGQCWNGSSSWSSLASAKKENNHA